MVCFGRRAALELTAGGISKNQNAVDRVLLEPLHLLWCDANGVLIFAHHYIKADISL